MASRLEVLESRMQHEELHSTLPNIEEYQLKIVCEQKDGLLEWLLFEKESKRYIFFSSMMKDR